MYDETNNDTLNRLVRKLYDIVYLDNFLALSKEFNKIGLTIHRTYKNRYILCKLINGTPSATELFSDYMFIGNISDTNEVASDKLIEKVVEFITKQCGDPSTPTISRPTWQDTSRPYGTAIRVQNEDVQFISQTLILD